MEIANAFGGIDGYESAVTELERALYEEVKW
jgi:hypothetical protein